MAGRGRTPKPQAERRTRAVPQRGEWQPTAGVGWQHGAVPDPPEGLCAESREAWTVWMRSWFASHWTPDDLPGLRILIQLHDQVQRAFDDPFIESEGPKGGTIYVKRPNPITELRQHADNYGITPRGQQDRRWAAPVKPEVEEKPAVKAGSSRYGHLRPVGSSEAAG